MARSAQLRSKGRRYRGLTPGYTREVKRRQARARRREWSGETCERRERACYRWWAD